MVWLNEVKLLIRLGPVAQTDYVRSCLTMGAIAKETEVRLRLAAENCAYGMKRQTKQTVKSWPRRSS